MFGLLRDWFERRIVARADISPAEWDAVFAALPVLDRLDGDGRRRLKKFAALFLHRKAIFGAHGLDVTPRMKLVIALQACLPILELGIECYDGWESVIVYPSGFAPERLVVDEYGVEHHVRDELAGEAWESGPVLLSWDDVAGAGEIDGYNLVIHEFAHKLDMQNGDSNGFPPLHGDMNPQTWTQIFSAAYEDFFRRCEQGEHISIDAYAAESPAEFFAVLSEVFFERPDLLDHYYPAVYAQLKLYYRQDPLAGTRRRFRSV